jgi:hypothetical protein
VIHLISALDNTKYADHGPMDGHDLESQHNSLALFVLLALEDDMFGCNLEDGMDVADKAGQHGLYRCICHTLGQDGIKLVGEWKECKT